MIPTGVPLIFDIETDGFLDETTVIHCIALSTTDFKHNKLYEPHEIEEALDVLSSASQVIGHNIWRFDIPAIKKLYPDWTYQSYIDTLVLSRLEYPELTDEGINMPKNQKGRHGLEAWGYRLGINKGDFGKETDWKEYSPEMGKYCLQDVHVNQVLYKKLIQYDPRSIELEHKFYEIIEQQNDNGWQFDTREAIRFSNQLQSEILDMEERGKGEFPQVPVKDKYEYWIDRGGLFETHYSHKGKADKSIRNELVPGPPLMKYFELGSNGQCITFLKNKYGWEPTSLTDKGNPKFDGPVLEELDYPEVSLMKEFRDTRKLYSAIAGGDKAWVKKVNKNNNRIYGRTLHNGAITGRCTHSNPNVAQTPSGKTERGKHCRSLFTVPEGKTLIGVDAAGLELRCLAHYLSPLDHGSYTRNFTDGGDVHWTTVQALAEAIGHPEVKGQERDEHNPLHEKVRNLAKTFIYAFNYGAGDAKIGLIIGGDSKAGRKMKNTFLKNLPALAELIKRVEDKADKTGELKGLDGRIFRLRDTRRALNTLLQGAGAVIMKTATVLLHESFKEHGLTLDDVKQVGHIHDEVQLEVANDKVELVKKLARQAIIDTGPALSLHCPLDGEAKAGKSWRETH